MQLDFHTFGFALTPALRTHAERRLAYALGRCDTQPSRLHVRLSDVNGPRGGDDKCCHLHLTVPGIDAVVVEDRDADLYVAIDRAAERAGRTLARRLERVRDRRHGPQPPVAPGGESQASLP